MIVPAEIFQRGQAAFRLLFSRPAASGGLELRKNVFLMCISGLLNSCRENEKNTVHTASPADYCNELYRTSGSEGIEQDFFSALFDSFTACGITPGELKNGQFSDNCTLLLRESISLMDFLLAVQATLPDYGILPGARGIFSGLDAFRDPVKLAGAIGESDRFLRGRVFRFIRGSFVPVKADSAKAVEKFFGFPSVRAIFQDHFAKFSSGISNIPLLIHSLPGYGKTSMTISYALAQPEMVVILPDPEALEQDWNDLMFPLTLRPDLKFVVFFDDIDPRSINWYKFRTHVGGAFSLPDNINVVLSANYEFPPSILSRGRRVNFPVFDEVRCLEMVEDFLHDFGLRSLPGNIVSLIAADYTEEFGQNKFTELSPRTLMRYLQIYQNNPVKRRTIVEIAMGPMITRPDPELFHEFNIELMRSLYGEEYIQRLLKERLRNL